MPDPILLTYADAVERIEKAAEGREDYVNAVPDDNGDYPLCQNLNEDGSGSCIVGTAFRAELIEEGLTHTDDYNFDGISAILSNVLANRIQVTPKALRFLEAVQESQDAGNSWGTAIEGAKASLTDSYRCYDDATPVADPLRYYF